MSEAAVFEFSVSSWSGHWSEAGSQSVFKAGGIKSFSKCEFLPVSSVCPSVRLQGELKTPDRTNATTRATTMRQLPACTFQNKTSHWARHVFLSLSFSYIPISNHFTLDPSARYWRYSCHIIVRKIIHIAARFRVIVWSFLFVHCAYTCWSSGELYPEHNEEKMAN